MQLYGDWASEMPVLASRGPLTDKEREERRLRKELEKAEKLLSKHQAREDKESVRQAERDERDKAREVTRRNASRMAMEDLQVRPTCLQASSSRSRLALSASRGPQDTHQVPAMSSCCFCLVRPSSTGQGKLSVPAALCWSWMPEAPPSAGARG